VICQQRTGSVTRSVRAVPACGSVESGLSYPAGMMVVVTTSVGLGELLASFAARAADDFTGKNARRAGRRPGGVHAVALVRWLGELEVPGPVCHVGVSGGELAALRPTTAAVSCRRSRGDGPAGQPGQAAPNQQLTLL
jgi:hypothetical protein